MADTPEGAALTRAYRAQQSAIAAEVAALVRETWPLLDKARVDATADRWLRVVLPLVVDGRIRSAGAAAAYLRSFSLVETGAPMVVVADDATAAVREATSASLRVTGPVQVKALTAAGYAPERVAATALEGVMGSTIRHVLDGGRVTVERSVARDPRTVGWRRVGVGANCPFCNMLIGRGEVYTANTVRFRAHDHCNCAAEPAWSGVPATLEQRAASLPRPAGRNAPTPEGRVAAYRAAAPAELRTLERTLADLERRAAAGEDLARPIEWQRSRIADLRRLIAA